MFTEIVNLMNNNMREDVDFFPLAFIVIRRIENIFTDLKKNIISNDTILKGHSAPNKQNEINIFLLPR